MIAQTLPIHTKKILEWMRNSHKNHNEKGGMFPSNGWFQYGPMRVYMRMGPKYIPSEAHVVWCLQIANVAIDDTKLRRNKIFTMFLNWIELAAGKQDIRFVYIENVMDGWLTEFLQRQDYKLLVSLPGLDCLYKKLHTS